MVERIWNLPNCYLNCSLRADYFTDELLQIDRVMPCDKMDILPLVVLITLAK